MPKLTPTKVIAARAAKILAVAIADEVTSRSGFMIKNSPEFRHVVTTHIINAIKADRKEKRRFQLQKDELCKLAKERADLWKK